MASYLPFTMITFSILRHHFCNHFVSHSQPFPSMEQIYRVGQKSSIKLVTAQSRNGHLSLVYTHLCLVLLFLWCQIVCLALNNSSVRYRHCPMFASSGWWQQPGVGGRQGGRPNVWHFLFTNGTGRRLCKIRPMRGHHPVLWPIMDLRTAAGKFSLVVRTMQYLLAGGWPM